MKKICILFVALCAILPALGQVAQGPFSGKIALHVIDDFEAGTAIEGYVIYDVTTVGGIPIPGVFDLVLPPDTYLPYGGTLNGIGILDGETLTVTTIQSITEPDTPEFRETTTWRTLVMLVNLSDLDQPCDRNAVEFEWSGDAVDSMEVFFDEMSYGTFDLQPTVVGPYTIASDSGSCSYRTWANQADAIARTQVQDFNDYDSYYYITPSFDNPPCSGGLARKDRAWSLGACRDHVFGHELGHNLGLNEVKGDGIRLWDFTTAMGGWRGGLHTLKHYNVVNKKALDWIPDERILDVPESGLYQLCANEYVVGDHHQALRLPLAGKDDYYLSYRTGQGNFGGHLDPEFAGKMSVHTGSGALGFISNFLSETDQGEVPYPKSWDDGETFIEPNGDFCATQVQHDGLVNSIWVSFECDPPPPLCPATSPCNGNSCVEGSGAGSSDMGYDSCIDLSGELMICPEGETVHVDYTTCVKGMCCYQTPGCLCPLVCGSGSKLVCH